MVKPHGLDTVGLDVPFFKLFFRLLALFGLCAREDRKSFLTLSQGNAMKCPKCPATVLLMSDRQGVEIDYCPQCRGVWLDRGELDKLIERSAAPEPVRPSATVARPDFEDSDHHNARPLHSGGYRPRKKSWMSEIFD